MRRKGESQVVVGTTRRAGATSFPRLRCARPDAGGEARCGEAVNRRRSLLERINRAEQSPLIEGERVTFVYRGAARRVEVVGDFTGWSPRGLVMREMPGTDVKYYTREFRPRRSRVEYKLIADGEWILDPLNPNRNDNGVGGENSNFTMPGYRASAYADRRRTALAARTPRHDASSSLCGRSAQQ